MNLSRIDYLILGALRDNIAVSVMHSITIKELNIDGIQRSGVLKHLIKLEKNGLIKKSGKAGKENIYYITETGLKLVNNAIEQKNQIVKELKEIKKSGEN